MTAPLRYPTDAARWRNVVREASTLENLRPNVGLIQQIAFAPDQLEFTLLSGDRFTVPASADRLAIAQAASRALGGTPVEVNPASEWAPPEHTLNYWWAETLYNFGMLAPEGAVMKPDVVFVRIWREGPIAKIEAKDASKLVTSHSIFATSTHRSTRSPMSSKHSENPGDEGRASALVTGRTLPRI